MDTPTRLPVLLQRRKSAFAGATVSRRTGSARSANGRKEAWRETGKTNAVTRPVKGGVVRGRSDPVNEDGAEVVHVGVGRTRLQQATEPGEKPGRIVVGKKGGGIETFAFR